MKPISRDRESASNPWVSLQTVPSNGKRSHAYSTSVYTGVAEFMGADPGMLPPILTIGVEQYEGELS